MKSPDKKRKKTKRRFLKAALPGVLDFLAEAGLLKKIKRSGWWVAGIKDPESVADHSFRCAVIGFCLAQGEGLDPYRVVVMALFNDIHEARINDLHKMGHHYIDFKDAERRVFQDQIAFLDQRIKGELKKLRVEYDGQKTPEALAARDADILECLLQAKEYLDQGYPTARKFFNRAPAYLRTETARRLWQKMNSWDSSRWWQGLVKFER